MDYTTLISPNNLVVHLYDPDWAVVDCRFSLADPTRGRRDYLKSHIPGAVYAHLDEDLSGPMTKGVTGRHPLPDIEKLSRVFSKMGIEPGVQVVAYDDTGGALAAVRLWWLLRWLGHDSVAVLDGGWPRWIKLGLPVQGGEETCPEETFVPEVQPDMVVTTEQVEAMRQNPDYRVIDARTAERYRGQNETIDPVAGHIPGSINAPYPENLTPEGTFKSEHDLRQYYEGILGSIPVKRAIFYCGSGVTAVHDILAMMYAGLGEPRLYAGSWSEWITDPTRPVARDSE